MTVKTELFNHIKKHHLCTDAKLIKLGADSNLEELCKDLKITTEDFNNSHHELEVFAKQYGIKASCFGDKDYPSAFYHLDNPPAIFYYKGKLSLINENYNISIVGTRSSSIYGEHCCRTLVEALKGYEVTIVSGLARGIDLTAHKSALHNKLKTIAVIGSGLMKFAYRGEQKVIFEELCHKQLVISEFHPLEHASLRSFAIRNRLIAALSNSTIVVEAPNSSGALITAKYCTELKRDLYAIPGDLNKASFKGSNNLLSTQEAKPIFQASKVAQVLGLEIETGEEETKLNQKRKKAYRKKATLEGSRTRLAKTKNRSLLDVNEDFEDERNAVIGSSRVALQDPLIELLEAGINDFDMLLYKSHYSSSHELIGHLTDLELQGRVERKGALYAIADNL